MTAYRYHETGLHPQVSCMYNQSTATFLTRINVGYVPSADSTLEQPSIFTCNGTLPSGPVTPCIGASYGGRPIHASALQANGTTCIGFVTDVEDNEHYRGLYQAQCEVNFPAQNYSIDVSVLDRTITVEPVSQASPPQWPANGTKLEKQTLDTIDVMSRILAPSLFTSVLGNAFTSNMANVAQPGIATEPQNLTGITDAITSLIDNSLVSINSAQLLIMEDTINIQAHVNSPAISFGTATYVYAVLAVNFSIVLFYMEDLLRTGCWRRLSNFRFSDTIHLAVAASGGGSNLYHAASKSLPKFPRSLLSEEVSNDVHVRLEKSFWPGIPVLVLDKGKEKEYRVGERDLGI